MPYSNPFHDNANELDATRETTCVLCNGMIQPHRKPNGEIYWTQGHNAEPLATGRCCDDCNTNLVTPKRIFDSVAFTVEDD